MADVQPPVTVEDVQRQASVATPRPVVTVADRRMVVADRTEVEADTVEADTAAVADMGGKTTPGFSPA